MGIGYALGNIVLAPQKYKNWAEVITSTVKRREPSKVTLKNGFKDRRQSSNSDLWCVKFFSIKYITLPISTLKTMISL